MLPVKKVGHWLVPSKLFKSDTSVGIKTVNCIPMKVEDEMLLWDFIDGNCTHEEEQKVKQLLANPAYRDEFESMIIMHKQLQQALRSPSSETDAAE